MHKQTDQTERPMRAGHGEKLASRLGSGGNVRAGESPAASTYLQKYRCGCFLEFARKKDIPRGCPHHMRDRLGAAIAV